MWHLYAPEATPNRTGVAAGRGAGQADFQTAGLAQRGGRAGQRAARSGRAGAAMSESNTFLRGAGGADGAGVDALAAGFCAGFAAGFLPCSRDSGISSTAFAADAPPTSRPSANAPPNISRRLTFDSSLITLSIPSTGMNAGNYQNYFAFGSSLLPLANPRLHKMPPRTCSWYQGFSQTSTR